MNKKYTINDLREKFGTERQCLEFIFNKNHKNINYCIKCGQVGITFWMNWKINRYTTSCGHIIPIKINTIFFRSSTPLVLWFHSIYLFTVSKNGISSKEIQRQLGVTYKTAWRIANRIINLMKNNDDFLNGIVEMDETYFGGKESNKYKNKRSKNGFMDKTPIIGMNERNGRFIVKVEENTTKKTLFKNINKYIKSNSLIITDELTAYKSIKKIGNYEHEKINHSKK